MATDSREGIQSGNAQTRIGSLSETHVVDMISEGEIQGLVTKEYQLDGTLGDIGYTSTTLTKSKSPLASVYWNNVPVVDEQGNFNYQDVNVKESIGSKNGSTQPLTRPETDDQIFKFLETTQVINERLRGPTKGSSDFPDNAEYFKKVYRVLNTDCFAIKLNIKILALNTVNKDNGSVQDNTVYIQAETRALFTNDEESFSNANGQGVNQNLAQNQSPLAGAFTGRISSPFIKSYFIDFSKRSDFSNIMDNPNFLGWEVKIYKTSEDPTTTDSNSRVMVDSLTEVYRTKLSYPNSATVSSTFSAEYFSSIPTRSFDVELMKVKIPSNYDPLTRSYHGDWDGTFSTESVGPFNTGPGTPGITQSDNLPRGLQKYYTNNPAWCFYDLITNPRYGLGKYITEQGFDKWTLYEIGQYCDTLVYDGMGKGELEPRFTCNTLVQSREDAFKVVQDMASVFRGLSYYAAGQIYAIQDSPKNPVYQFTNANVEQGEFSYSNTSRKVRNNVAIIRYNDRQNFYKPAIEYTEDVDGIRKNGIRETEVTAFGCTSRGQAMRLGKWMMATENLETETITFTAGLEGTYLRPGDVVSVSDTNRRNITRNGGRTSNIDQSNNNESGTYAEITLDSTLDTYRQGDVNSAADPAQMYQLSILVPKASLDPYNVNDLSSSDKSEIRSSQVQTLKFQGNQVTDVEDNGVTKSKITFSGGYNFNLDNTTIQQDQTVWAVSPTGGDSLLNSQGITIDSDDLSEKYRIINVKEERKNKYVVNAIEYSEEKYSRIEEDFESNADGNNISLTLPNAPSSITLDESRAPGSQHTQLIKYTVSPPSDQIALAGYEVYMKKTSQWVIADYTGRYPTLWTDNNGNVTFMEENTLTNDKNYVPDSKYKISKHPKSNSAIEKQVVANTSTEYFFKAVSFNGLGNHSAETTTNSIVIDDSEAIKDVVISNLRLEGDTTILNDSAELQTLDGGITAYTGTSPNLLWDTSIQGAAELATQFNYAISLRQTIDPSIRQGSEPTNNIFKIITGFEPTLTQDGSFVYSIPASDLATIQTNEGESNARNFDVVVEAHSEDGLTSAGGNIVADASTFAEKYDLKYEVAKGWDIAMLNNVQIDNPRFSASADDCGDLDRICTIQSITSDNRLKVEFTKNTYKADEKDVAGGFFYSSPTEFTKEEIAGQPQSFFDNNEKNIQRVRMDNYSDVMYVPFRGELLTTKLFCAYSLFDTFDRDIESVYLDQNPNNTNYNPDYDLGSTLPLSSVSEINYVNPLIERPSDIKPVTFAIQTNKLLNHFHFHGNGQAYGWRAAGTHTITKPIGKTKILWMRFSAKVYGAVYYHGRNSYASNITGFRFFYLGQEFNLKQGDDEIVAVENFTYTRGLNSSSSQSSVSLRIKNYSFDGFFNLGIVGQEFPEGDADAGTVQVQVHGNWGDPYHRPIHSYTMEAYWK